MNFVENLADKKKPWGYIRKWVKSVFRDICLKSKGVLEFKGDNIL